MVALLDVDSEPDADAAAAAPVEAVELSPDDGELSDDAEALSDDAEPLPTLAPSRLSVR